MAELRRNGFQKQLLVMQSNGGTASPEQAGRLGCAALLSGPAGGVAAAARVGESCGIRNVIGVDMGGTSYDVSLIRDGAPETRSESWFNRSFVGLPMLGIHTIGAGGGSIAWIDDGGALRVGPQSAGARPGPACYGLGGADATVTDAFLYLGYLNPDFFLGGRMTILPERAADVLRIGVAEKLGMSVDEAAFSVFRIINNNLSNGIRYVSVAQGHDPRDFALMSFGGARQRYRNHAGTRPGDHTGVGAADRFGVLRARRIAIRFACLTNSRARRPCRARAGQATQRAT